MELRGVLLAEVQLTTPDGLRAPRESRAVPGAEQTRARWAGRRAGPEPVLSTVEPGSRAVVVQVPGPRALGRWP
ncbi:MAG: hypothetical protein AVDCRST_MAG48-3586 [uncultured Friedmanniella sp.]|uniref:Uncharacterized protein n=1 Tax=uncultured Friedmanniella sp. TaxID=335381 RepID=A0A6J4LWN7_9ACTN|nr:MAG: hypothetical protein AVDCRST_MAG48-3586 [uncultured Friedmanniella sp.]